ncbi:uncharacterized protein G2W53_036922 [Senna tora]|uniref:Uncharacterized protein n=1 Tax=Senna tora TaxID=362788 RepID=A0A834T5L8_9FABA|nr:uncharacterized protein G2W53_036922 [Senna tora]
MATLSDRHQKHLKKRRNRINVDPI